MPELRDAFAADGFAIARGLIAPAALDEVRADLERIFAQQVARTGASPAAGDDALTGLATALFQADRAAYLAAAKLAQHAASLHRLSLGDPILDALRDLGLALPTVCTRPVLHIMADALRIEGGYHKTPPHQDWRSTQGSLDSVIVWLPFADVRRDGYPLEVIPGSHRRGLLPSVDDPFGHRVAEGVVADEEFRPLEVDKGDAVLLSTFTVHRTGARGGERVRLAGSFRFNNAAEPSFVARNYPNPYVYRPDMRLLQEGFPTPADVAAALGTGEPRRR